MLGMRATRRSGLAITYFGAGTLAKSWTFLWNCRLYCSPLVEDLAWTAVALIGRVMDRMKER